MSTANMSRAMEAYTEGDALEMGRYLKLELANNPKNGYALAWRALVNNYYDEHGAAITDASEALKQLPHKDAEYRIFALTQRAEAYLAVEDTAKALGDYNAAIKLQPNNADLYSGRGLIYYNQKKYDLCDADYRKYCQLNPGDPMGFVALGRSQLRQDKPKEALVLFEHAVKLSGNTYSLAYSFRAEAFLRLGRFDESADDIVTALAIDSDNKAWIHMFEVADSSYLTMTSRLKVQQNKEPNNPFWPYSLGYVAKHRKKYDKAIEYFKEALAKEDNDSFYERIAACYSDMGNYTTALGYINKAIERDTNDIDYRNSRADIFYELGDMENLYKDLEFCIAQAPDPSPYYYRRGWYKGLDGDNEGAVEDLTACITQSPRYAYAYLNRGERLLDLGDEAAARRDFQRCLEIDTANKSIMDCAWYALLQLGDERGAMRLLDTMLAYNHESAGGYYDAACLYSRMNQKTKAMEYLRMALERGYTRFTHIERDHDLDNIRDEEEFKRLIEEYKDKKQVKNEGKPAPDSEIKSGGVTKGGVGPLGMAESKTAEIPFRRRGGVQEVACKVNGLPLNFIFDTGAGDVTISSVEAAFMFKNGYLSSKDVLGKASYRTASGDIVAGTVINLDRIELAEGVTLNNVRASVVKGQEAPLLLGQSVFRRLGKIEIDNQRQVIRVTY